MYAIPVKKYNPVEVLDIVEAIWLLITEVHTFVMEYFKRYGKVLHNG